MESASNYRQTCFDSCNLLISTYKVKRFIQSKRIQKIFQSDRINNQNFSIILIQALYCIILLNQLMFIKEAYQRRITDQLSKQEQTFNKYRNKSPVIGSVNTGRVNFQSQQHFFAESDIPQNSKRAKNIVKNFLDPDILQLKKRQWNISVESPKKFDSFKPSHQQNLHKIRNGFYDYYPKLNQQRNKVYQGTDTRNSFKNWNVSTEVSKREINKNLFKTNMSSLQNSILFNSTELKEYVKPTKRYELQEKLKRSIKERDSDFEHTIKKQFKLYNPDASPQKTNAIAFKILEQERLKSLKNSLYPTDDDFQLTRKVKPNLSMSQKMNISIKYQHSGSWSKVPNNKNRNLQNKQQQVYEQTQMAWSCCMNQDQNSRGCVRKIIDQNKMNFASFNNE